MRADRLVAVLLLMQARGRVTAAELARELEVSVATARRDLEALSAAGVPVYPQPGRGGGWSLVGGARTDLTGLSAAEAQALFLLLGPAAASAAVPAATSATAPEAVSAAAASGAADPGVADPGVADSGAASLGGVGSGSAGRSGAGSGSADLGGVGSAAACLDGVGSAVAGLDGAGSEATGRGGAGAGAATRGGSGSGAAVSERARAALRKLLRALPETFRADAEAAAAATVIDPTRWGERERARPEAVDLLQSAVIRHLKVSLTYTDRAGERSRRLVDPWGVVDKDDIWYLIAGTERGQRTFRVDRIVTAEMTDMPADRPDDFTLSAAWREVVGRVEERRSRTWATVLVETRLVDVLHDQFGRHFEIEAEEGDGRSRVRLGAPTPLDIARHLAGWGAMVEVVEPRSVQVVLARIGAELTDRYSE